MAWSRPDSSPATAAYSWQRDSREGNDAGLLSRALSKGTCLAGAPGGDIILPAPNTPLLIRRRGGRCATGTSSTRTVSNQYARTLATRVSPSLSLCPPTHIPGASTVPPSVSLEAVEFASLDLLLCLFRRLVGAAVGFRRPEKRCRVCDGVPVGVGGLGILCTQLVNAGRGSRRGDM
jgi:hypothetical protein